MAFKRTFRRKRLFKRKPRRVRRYRRRNVNTGAYAKRFFKLRRVVNVVSTATGNFLQFNDNPSLSQDWAPVSELFQMYRVNGLRLHYIPSFNNNPLQAANGFTPMYMFHDTNMTITTAPSENSVLQYEGLKIRTLSRMHSTYFKMSRRINATAPGTLSTDGYSTVQAPQINQQVIVYIPPGTTAGTLLGRFVITAYVTAKVRK